MLRIKSVRIQGMHNVVDKTYELDAVNYFHGPNGSGKSTVLEAIQLALLGYIPRTAKTNNALFRHANCDTMRIELVITNGRQDKSIIRKWAKSGSKITSTLEPEDFKTSKLLGDIATPVIDFASFQNMTANALKDWFIEFLPEESLDVDWDIELMSSVDDYGSTEYDGEIYREAKDIISRCSSESSRNIDIIRNVNKKFKESVSVAKRGRDRDQAHLQSMMSSLQHVDSESKAYLRNKMHDLESKIKERDSALSQRSAQEDIRSNIQRLTDQINDVTFVKLLDYDYDSMEHYADDRIQHYEFDIATCDNRIKDIQDKLSDLKASLAAKRYEFDVSESTVSKGDVCPVLGESCDRISNHVDYVNDALENMIQEMHVFESNISELTDQVNSMSDDLDSKRAHLSTFKSDYKCAEMIHSLQNSVEDVFVPFENIDLESEYECIRSKLVEVNKREADRERCDWLENQIREDIRRVELFSSWAKLTGVNGLQSAPSQRGPFEQLSGHMNDMIHAFFDNNTQAAFNLESKANSFSFGITRTNMLKEDYIPYEQLSSGEKCRFAIALTSAIVRMSSAPLKIILFDDVFDHLDDESADDIIGCMQNIYDIQVILAGVRNLDSKHLNIVHDVTVCD